MNKQEQTYHVPVLLKETVDGLNIKPDGVYVDVTYGGGGHSKEILNRLGPAGKLYAFDQDEEAHKNKIEDNRLTLIEGNFSNLKNYLRAEGVKQVDGVLADLGISSHQINKPERGFSIRYDEKLDMRMDINASFSAFELVNNYSERQLQNIFSQYGDLRNAGTLARSIMKAREDKPIETTGELVETVSKHFPKLKQNKFLAKLFQAIRIEVNGEIEALKNMLKQAAEVIKPGGRLSVISYHSLEDRLVKRFIRDGMFQGQPEKDVYGNVEVPFRKVGKLIIPSEEEVKRNPRARSAKLRIGEKLHG